MLDGGGRPAAPSCSGFSGALGYDLLLFYRQVARRLGQPTKFSDRLAYTHRIDPLKSWVIEHRKQFRTLRDQQWRVRTRHPYDPRLLDAVLPTNRHIN